MEFRDYTIEELLNIVDFRKIKPEWEQLVNPSIYNLTHTYEWFYSLWKSKTGFKNVRAIAIRRAGRLISVMHMVFETDYQNKPELLITIPTSLTPFYAESDHDKIIDCLLYYLDNKLPNWNVIEFEEFDCSFPETQMLIESGKRAGLEVIVEKTFNTPIIQINNASEEYFLECSRRVKKALGNKANLLREISNYRMRVYTDPAEIQLGLDRIFEIDCLSWKFSEQSDMGSRSGQLVFYETMAHELAKRGNIILTVLELDKTNEPIAFEYLIAYKDKLLGAKHSYKDVYSKYSPGVILRDEIFKYMRNNGFRTFDTWSNKDRFKMIWCNQVVERYTVHINKTSITVEDELILLSHV
ncbi:hypothetical protein A3844_04320 [Paenibacillus helianthi]|uniref:BioF2-like acetyltransferase domain-containing protein n=1 Tax=Paenibacillus helianthi TaxID=1349432 RepID=A0ABX3ET00_9BACL|nr:GNAT family N-acetyltransferase [Paenibacillus helianthi]OKP91073.1 hypothetical protein A3844_04320 [Paenibacillus helianthi]